MIQKDSLVKDTIGYQVGYDGDDSAIERAREKALERYKKFFGE